MSRRKKDYYAVARGRRPGIYDEWCGEDGAEAHVKGFPDALYKGFRTRADAKEWLKRHGGAQESVQPEAERSKPAASRGAKGRKGAPKGRKVRIYTDGGAIVNPGPGGYGVVILDGKRRKELSGARRRTTNNRMELMACIEGLKATRNRSVVIHSDFRYVINGMKKGWARRWRASGWMRNKTESAENADLWAQLLDLCAERSVDWVWVKGHAGNRENERCDRLARTALAKRTLPPDEAFESGKTRLSAPSLFD